MHFMFALYGRISVPMEVIRLEKFLRTLSCSCMLKQRVRPKQTVWIENGKPRHVTVWACMITVKKLDKRAIKQAKLVQSNKRGQYIKHLLLHNDGKF